MGNLLARVRQRFAGYTPPQYWIDKMVEEYRKALPPDQLQILGLVEAHLFHVPSGEKLVIPGLNLITNNGDRYYAQRGAQETVTNDFVGVNAGLRLGSSATAPAKTDNDVTTFLATSAHAVDATYPKTNDTGDADNTGDGVNVVTWRFSYTTGEGNVSSIREGAIVDNRTTPTVALNHFLFAALFDKTSSDTLKVIINHSATGV